MKLKNKGIYYSIIGALALSGALLITSVCVRAANSGVLTDEVEHTDLSFDELTYFEDVTPEEFDALTARLEAAITDTANAEEVDELIDQMEDMARRMMANQVIADVYTTLDADNDAYDDTSKHYTELLIDLDDKVQQNYRMIAESACSDVLHARVDNEERWQDILEYEPMTDEQKELSNREKELSLKYDELYNADYTVTIGGREYNSDTIGDAYDSGDISVMEYFEGFADILTQRNQVLGELFIELVDVRTQIAHSYGYDNYADYAYKELYDRDYSSDDLQEYRQQVIDYIVPVEHELYDLMTSDPNYQDMWNAEMSQEECLEQLKTYLPEISEDMLISYQYMVDHGMCDLGIDEKKAPGGYTTAIYEYNAPYMFNCADGTISDMETLIHEFGHYNEMYFASEDEWDHSYANLDVAEIHSQGMELLYLDHAEEIYGEYADIVKIYTLMNMAYACVEGVKEDAFQYAVYSNPDNLTVEKLNQIYYDCCEDYGSLDLTNSYYLGMYGFMENDEIVEWVEIPHTFQSPLYYVSYSVSMAAVEELWDVILDDKDEGIDIYLDLVNHGMVDSFSLVLDEVGLNNPIENPRMDVYAANIRYYLGLQDDRLTTEEAGSDDVIQEPEEEEEDRPVRDHDDDDDGDRGSHRDRDRDQSDALNAGLIVAVVVGVVVLAVLVIVIVVIVTSNNNKKKKAAMQGMVPSGLPPQQPMQYGQPVPPMQPGQPMQYGQPGPPMQPGQPMMPPPIPQQPANQPMMPPPIPQQPINQPMTPPPMAPQNAEQPTASEDHKSEQ